MYRLSSSVFSALVLSAVAALAYDPTRSDNVSDLLSYRTLLRRDRVLRVVGTPLRLRPSSRRVLSEL
jgi:hypothetical protein